MKSPFLALLLGTGLAHGVALDFNAGGNAHLDSQNGPVNLGVTTVTKAGIADGHGGALDLTVTSTGGNINSADVGVGVEGGGGGGRLDAGESLALSFDRDVLVTGYTLEQFGGADNSTHATPAKGPVTETVATVTGLCLPLVAGETFTLSTSAGDGIRLASVTVDPASVLFRDSFARAAQPNNDIDADSGGMAGSLAPLGYFEGRDVAVGMTNVESNQLHLADGPNSSQIHVEHNFIDAAIVAAGGFAVGLDLVSNDGGADDQDRFIGFGVGMSAAEIANYGADFNATVAVPGIRGSGAAGTGIADWSIVFTRNGVNGEENRLLVRIYQNGVRTTSYTTFDSGNPIQIGQRGQFSVRFACNSMAAGAKVIPIIRWGQETIGAADDNSFTWQAANSNHIGITARQDLAGWTADDFSVTAVTPDVVTEAVDDTFEVAQDSPPTGLAVLANDLGFATASGLAAVSDPDDGSAAINGTMIDYTPDPGFSGTDTFTYELGNGSTATVTVHVLPPARDDFYQVLHDSGPNSLSVRDNDTTAAPFAGVSDPAHGTAAINGSRIDYTPDPGHVGADSFTYTLDGGLVATVTLDVRPHPNFVVIYTDDQGWTSLDVEMDKDNPDSKSDYHVTPEIAGLVAEGMRISRGYSPAPNCSPSRYGILTGKTCLRLGLTDIVGRNANATPNTNYLLVSPGKKVDAIQAAEATTPELLKSIAGAGYTTAHFGKWHLGGGGPANHGFDASDGGTGNNEGNAGPANTAVDDPKLAYSLNERAMTWMQSQAANPFYLQVSHYAVHSEIQFSARSRAIYDTRPPGAKHNKPNYAAMLTDLDTSVGLLLEKIDALGLRHSTYVIYQADNGAPADLSDNAPLRGFKPEVWEGGIRVPTIVRGPGIAPDSQLDTPMMGIDLLPTIWEWAEQPASALPADLDGGSLVSAIRSASTGIRNPPVTRPGEIVAYSPHYVQDGLKDQTPRAIIIDGDYKLVVQFELGTVELYHLEQRVEEDTDLAGIDIGKRWQLWVRLRDYMKSAGALYALPDPDNFGPADGIADGDADNDGLPDEWEMREMLSIAFDGSADTDGDGVTDGEERLAGTDPLLPGSLSIDSIVRQGDGSLTLAWTSSPGVYQIDASDDLEDWETIGIVTSNDFPAGTSVDLDPEENRRFYRVSRVP